jgi:hypothetical protein
MNIDPDGLDWYRHDETGATLWRDSNDDSYTSTAGQSFRNIGETYSQVQNGLRVDYEQNTIVNTTELGSKFNQENGEFIPKTVTTDDGSKINITF